MMMMRMPPVAPLSPKGNRPDEHPQSHHKQRTGINGKLRYSGPGGNQRPNRILFADAEGAGQKNNGFCHATTYIGMLILSPVKLLFRLIAHQDKADRLFFNCLGGRRGAAMAAYCHARGAYFSDSRLVTVSLPRPADRLRSSA